MSKNLIVEQNLYEYKNLPLERFTFCQISSELIFVHPWIVGLGCHQSQNWCYQGATVLQFPLGLLPKKLVGLAWKRLALGHYRHV